MNNKQPNMEQWLAQTAVSFPYPPTPDLAANGRQRLTPRAVSRRWQWATAVLLLFLATLVAVPSTRASLFSWLRLGAVKVVSDGTPPSTPIALPALPGRTTLAEAQTAVPFHIATPAALGVPDAVYQSGDSVMLVWPADGVLLQLLGFDIMATKMQVDFAEAVRVSGQTAVWIADDHLLTIYDERYGQVPQFTRRIDGHVLIWVRDGVTYRLESHLPQAAAIALAESVGP